jgi:hypothetical protein
VRAVTLVGVARDAKRLSWPALDPKVPPRECDRVYPIELGEALERPFRTDVHILPYRPAHGWRLNRTALDAGVAVEMTAVLFDFDCAATHGTPEPAPESWRREIREKVCALFDAEGAGFYYETKGGARVAYGQATPTVISTQDNAKEWSRGYAVLAANLKRRFDLAADPSCGDWQRSFRAPRATRTPGGPHENWPVFGDANRIADLFIEATAEDVETVKRASTVFQASRPAKPSAPGAGGDGLLYHALDLRGHVGDKAPRGGWIALCPNRSEHTVDTDWTDTTIVVPPSSGNEVGLIVCKHGHCSEKFTVKQWLAMFSDSELERARERAGVARKQRAA